MTSESECQGVHSAPFQLFDVNAPPEFSDGCGRANQQYIIMSAVCQWVKNTSVLLIIIQPASCFSVSRPRFPLFSCCCCRSSSVHHHLSMELFATQLLALLDTKHAMCLLGKAAAVENQLQFRLSTLIESYTTLAVVVVVVVDSNVAVEG